MIVTFNFSGRDCCWCKAKGWSCGSPHATEENQYRGLWEFEVLRTGECRRRSEQNLLDAACRAGEKAAEEREKRILEVLK